MSLPSKLAWLLTVAIVPFALSVSARADAPPKMDAASKEAVDKTKQLLTSPSDRAKAIKGDSQAEAAHERAKAAGGGSEANTEKIYGMSADIFDKMATNTGGDSTKMQEQLLKAQGNPEAFFNSLTPEQRAAIEKLAKDMGSKQNGH